MTRSRAGRVGELDGGRWEALRRGLSVGRCAFFSWVAVSVSRGSPLPRGAHNKPAQEGYGACLGRRSTSSGGSRGMGEGRPPRGPPRPSSRASPPRVLPGPPPSPPRGCPPPLLAPCPPLPGGPAGPSAILSPGDLPALGRPSPALPPPPRRTLRSRGSLRPSSFAREAWHGPRRRRCLLGEPN